MSNKSKRIIGFVLLLINLVIIKLFLGGKYLYHFWEELIPELLVLLIVSFILMIVPLIFRLVNKKRLEYKKGKIICLFNSLILFIVFSIPNLLTILKGNNNAEIMSIDPISFSKSLIIVYIIIAIIYYFINMCFFVDNKN
jgi:membrane protease YdiL (CAAX protease family)